MSDRGKFRNPVLWFPGVPFLLVVVVVHFCKGDHLNDMLQSHLSKTEKEAERLIGEHLAGIDRFFANAKRKTPIFAKEVVSWRSKWQTLADFVGGGDQSRIFIQEKFGEIIFKPDMIQKSVNYEVKSYFDQLREIESKMLVELRKDLSSLESPHPNVRLDEKGSQASYEKALHRLAEAGGSQLQVDISKSLADSITTDVLNSVVRRILAPAGIAAAGAPLTFGTSLVWFVLADQMSSRLVNIANPIGDIEVEIDRKLDEMKKLVVDELRSQLKQTARERAFLRSKAVLSLFQSTGGVSK